MQKYFNNVVNRVGDVVPGASVYVTVGSTGAAATIYSDDGVTSQANPITCDGSGAFYFYAADDVYTLTISGRGIQTLTISGVLLEDNVDFTQSGSGAVVRTLLAKAREGVSVQDFGAAGDGVTDDTNAIRAAVLLARRVWFPKTSAHYKVSNYIDLPRGCCIESDGAEIKRYHDYTVATAIFQMGSGGNVIRGLVFNGNAAAFGGSIAVIGTNFTLYIDVLIYNSAATGETAVTIEECSFKDSCGSFIVGGQNLTVRRNQFGNYLDHAVYFGHGTLDGQVIANRFYADSANCTREAVKTRNGVERVSVLDNEFYLPNATFFTFDSGGTPANYDSTGLKVSGNNGEASAFGGSQTGVQAGLSATWGVLRDVSITNNKVICTGGYALNFDKGNANDPTWYGGIIDELLVQGNEFYGKSLISIGGVKNRSDGYHGIKRLAILGNLFAPNPKTQAFNTGVAFYLTGDIGHIAIKNNEWVCDSNLNANLIRTDFGLAATVANWQSDATKPGPSKERTWDISGNTVMGYFAFFYDQGTPTTDGSVFTALDTFRVKDNTFKFSYASQPYVVNASALANNAAWYVGGNIVIDNATYRIFSKAHWDNASFAGAYIQRTSVDYLESKATYDPGSLTDGAGATTTVTVTGAALGDPVQASFDKDLQVITLTAWVSSANTVSVRFQNESGGTIDLASGTLRCRVLK